MEIKPTAPEPARPRSFGRPPKKEYPAFDINPRMARDFLTRLKTWKESDDSTSVQREFYRRKENHDVVDFQGPSEQYAQWKDSDLEEEEVQPVVAPPTSWAEALRRKTNLANGISEEFQVPKGKHFQASTWHFVKSSFKGPVKPKLVARAPGSDQSPWKIKKDAPKISAKDVPGALRSLMSCALWRLHEHIDRNDTNELFLLSDQTEIRTLAEKLNIAVRSAPELKKVLASKTKKVDIATFGDLERDFGIQGKASDAAALDVLTSVHKEAEASQHSDNDVTKSSEKTDGPMLIEENGRHDGSKLSHAIVQPQVETQTEGMVTNGPTNEQRSPAAGYGDEKTLAEEPLVKSTVTLVEAAAPTKLAWSAVVKAGSHEAKKPFDNAKNSNGLTTNKLHNTLSRDGPAQEDQKNLENTPTLASRGSIPPQLGSTNPVQPTADQRVHASTPPYLPKAVVNTPLQQSQPTDEPEDSDEEVVVFKPSAKRYSTQKKPMQQNSRPSTPVTPSQEKALMPAIQPRQKPAIESPDPAALKSQQQPRPGSSHGRNPMAISHGHPQPRSSPTVIDPDAFGRSFAVNHNPSPRTLHNPRSHHHPRPPIHNNQLPQASRSPHREHPHTSPPRQTPREDPQQLSPAPEPKLRIAPRTSPRRRLRAFEPETGAAKAFDPTPGAERRPTTPASKKVEVDDFVPRSAFSEAQFKPQTFQPKSFEATEFVPRSQMSETQPKTIIPPKAVEPTDDFVPRSAMSQPLYKPRTSEPESVEPRASMPDVQYVLKSGSTRASARGRGRLWTPS